MEELAAIDCLLLFASAHCHNISDDEENIPPQLPQRKRLSESFPNYTKHPTHLDFPNLFHFNSMNFDNAKDLPEGIADTDDFAFNYHCKQLHHDDPDFPGVPPDLFCNDPDDRDSGFTHVADMSERRLRFLQQMNANRATSANLFQAGRRHYVKGAVHEKVKGLFYIPDMEQPKRVNGDWETTKYRLTVEILDSKKNSITVTYVEFGHTPLHELFINSFFLFE